MDAVSLRLQLNTFHRLFAGFLVMDGICMLSRVKWNLLMVLIFF